MTQYFPDGFGALERFQDWACETELARHAKKGSVPYREVQAFYDAMLPLLPDALDHLNRFDLKALPEPEQHLLRLCLAMIEASMAVELFEDANPKYLMPLERFFPVHDQWRTAAENQAKPRARSAMAA